MIGILAFIASAVMAGAAIFLYFGKYWYLYLTTKDDDD